MKTKSKRTFVFKCRWRGTALLIKLRAKNEEEAREMAAKRRDCIGCLDMILVEERDI